MNRLIITCLALVLALLPNSLQARTKAFPVTVTDDRGNRVHVSKVPTRLLSLDPRDTETLFALGLEGRIVGDGSKYAEGAATTANFAYPSQWPSRRGRDYPSKAKALPHVEGGCCGTPYNLETITSLHPDLVIAPYSKTEEPTYTKIRELGFKLIILDPSNLKGILHDISIVGIATGSVTQASAVIKVIRKQVASVRAALAHVRSRPRVYYEIDATNPTQPYTAGPGTFIDEAVRLAGGKNVADGVTSCSGTLCYPQFSLESLVQRNPQVILLGDAAFGTTPDSVKGRAGWETISAVQSGRIYPFDDSTVSRAGPRIGVGLRVLARLVHPSALAHRP